MLAEIEVPTTSGSLKFPLKKGRSTVFVGANGAGKTRLGVFVEQKLPQETVHRIAAHRSLALNDSLNSIGLDRALKGLREGHPDAGALKIAHRWDQKPATKLLYDYDFVLQALFAEQSRVAIAHLESRRVSPNEPPPSTCLARLQKIWEQLLPGRKLRLLEMSVQVIPLGSGGTSYAASEMSDGERVIFYMIGQCLLAQQNSIVIIDEPELHVHKAIIGRLWDLIEAERPDCAFIYITHDLDFVIARPTASKYVVREFSSPNKWDIELLPENTGLPDRVVSELVGSRQPVLFVEGDRGSVDATIYRSAYDSFLVEPIGSCEAVIHSVASFRRNVTLHRIGAVRGCVDADAREKAELEILREQGIHVLPVAEIENVLILPPIFTELAKALHFSDDDITTRSENLTIDILAQAARDLDSASVRYAARRLDAELKRLGPTAKTIADLSSKYQAAVANIDPTALAKSYRTKLEDAIKARDVRTVLALYDNKGLLSLGAIRLGLKGKNELTEFAGRLLFGTSGEAALKALKAELPSITI